MFKFQMNAAVALRFYEELKAIRERLDATRGEADLRHLQKIERWGRMATLIGYGTAWLGFHPIAWLGMGLGISTRWMCIAHHVLHGGFDRIPNIPAKYRSHTFASRGRRWMDWCDWISPRAWQVEHNGLHHGRVGERLDPDVPEENYGILATSKLPKPVKLFLVALSAVLWKGLYYGPNVLLQYERRRANSRTFDLFSPDIWNPTRELARKIWVESWGFYLLFRFGLFPLPFLFLGTQAWVWVILNTAVAEILTAVHSFLVIVPNHAGEELPRFSEQAKTTVEQTLRQIVGSVNFHTGSDWNDFLHGWLNYQIEHHIWPNLTLRQYQLAQPEVKALCERYGVPYIQQSVGDRVRKLAANAIGDSRMWRVGSLTVDGKPKDLPSDSHYATAEARF